MHARLWCECMTLLTTKPDFGYHKSTHVGQVRSHVEVSQPNGREYGEVYDGPVTLGFWAMFWYVRERTQMVGQNTQYHRNLTRRSAGEEYFSSIVLTSASFHHSPSTATATKNVEKGVHRRQILWLLIFAKRMYLSLTTLAQLTILPIWFGILLTLYTREDK